jgi:hypothetical protein
MFMYPWMYVVLLGLVLIVYARLLPKNEAASPKNSVVQDIENTIEHFASEMDEQNKTILDLFTRTKQDYEVELAKLAGRMELLEKQKSELSHELNKIHISSPIDAINPIRSIENTDALEAMLDPKVEEPNVLPPEEEIIDKGTLHGLSMKIRYTELFNLYDQGKGVEAIAKKLSMNKGEVNLILQLSRQEESSRV